LGLVTLETTVIISSLVARLLLLLLFTMGEVVRSMVSVAKKYIDQNQTSILGYFSMVYEKDEVLYELT
jgi:hypothetical protein